MRAALLRLLERFVPERAAGVDATIAVVVDGQRTYGVTVRDQRCLISAQAPVDPDVTLAADPTTWVELLDGTVDPVAAFMAGRLVVRGDLNLALHVATLFTAGPTVPVRQLRTRRTQIGGLTISSLVGGSGEPLVLLHGLGASKVSFLPVVDGLVDRFEIHALDLPGFGKSDRPLPLGNRYSPRWMARVVRRYLDHHLPRPVHLVGNSMGGRIALEVALRAPDRVRSVVLLDSAVVLDGVRWVRPLLKLVRGQWLGAAPMPVRVEWVEWALRSMFHNPERVPVLNMRAAAEEFLRDLGDPRFRMALLACARHLGAEPGSGRRGFWTRLQRLAVPSLWIWGAADPLIPPSYAERVRRTVPDATVEVWEGVGHVPQFEVPLRTNEAIAAFVDRHR